MRRPGEAVQVSFLEVIARGNESPERMIKRFTRKVRNDGVLQEVYERKAFVKPSDARRRKRSRARFLSSQDAG